MLPLSLTFEEIRVNFVDSIFGGFSSVEANNIGVLNPPIMKGLNKILIPSIRSSLKSAPDNLPAEEIIILLIFNLLYIFDNIFFRSTHSLPEIK